MEKRKFYNTGDAKGFTKQVFFQTVRALANGEAVSPNFLDLVAAAADYELDGILQRATNKEDGPKKDPLDSEYATLIREAIKPLITNDPKTREELIALATAKGKIGPSGKAFSAPWLSRVFDNEPGIVKVKKVIEKTNPTTNLKSQVEVSAYKKA